MRLVLAVILALALAAPAAAQETAGAPAIRSVIERQIEAFRADDVARAFSFASPGIRALFGTPERFGAMVRQGYPMVWRPEAVEFLDTRVIDGATWQAVRIRDAAGRSHILGYRMERGAGGEWTIGGVQILRAPAAGV